MRARVLLLLIWAASLGTALVAPSLTPAADAVAWHVRRPVDIALAFYVLAIAGIITCRRENWRAFGERPRTLRLCWSLAWIAYLIHVILAFHHAHGWSHRHAMEHTGRVSGFPEGIFVSHAFTVIWGIDAAWWWCSPTRYVHRAAWIGGCVHAFMAFIIVNGTVVYETGAVRWIGAAATGAIIALWIRSKWTQPPAS